MLSALKTRVHKCGSKFYIWLLIDTKARFVFNKQHAIFAWHQNQCISMYQVSWCNPSVKCINKLRSMKEEHSESLFFCLHFAALRFDLPSCNMIIVNHGNMHWRLVTQISLNSRGVYVNVNSLHKLPHLLLQIVFGNCRPSHCMILI